MGGDFVSPQDKVLYTNLIVFGGLGGAKLFPVFGGLGGAKLSLFWGFRGSEALPVFGFWGVVCEGCVVFLVGATPLFLGFVGVVCGSVFFWVLGKLCPPW